MNEASLIISTLALIQSTVVLVWMLAKHFSSHVIQYVEAPNPLKGKKGASIFDQFAEIGQPAVDPDIGDDE